MGFRSIPAACIILLMLVAFPAHSQTSSSSSHSSPNARKVSRPDSFPDPGSVSNGRYRNKTFGFTCKIPEGWVLRTNEMNAPPERPLDSSKSDNVSASSSGAKVLLAAFSRPPEARGEEVNSSILIAAETAAAYPGLTEPVQYFDPLTEVARAQGFSPDEDPYEVAVGSKTLVRRDFHKNVGTRVMRQSTLAMLTHGYAVSFTVIGGTDQEVEDLIDGLDFQTTPPTPSAPK